MKIFKITLLTNVGDICFGMRRDDVREKLGTFSEFRKSKSSKNTTDDFSFCHAFYNMQNRLEAIEFFPGMDTTLIMNTVDLFKITYHELVNLVKGLDQKVEINPDGFVSKRGISAYAPVGNTESILLSSREYWS